jgi:hypothetical protein
MSWSMSWSMSCSMSWSLSWSMSWVDEFGCQRVVVDQLSRSISCQVDELSVDEMSVNESSVDELSVDEYSSHRESDEGKKFYKIDVSFR